MLELTLSQPRNFTSNHQKPRGTGSKTVHWLDLVRGFSQREIEFALLDGTIDLAVHSMKDLPTKLPDGLYIGAIPSREDPRDVLVSALGLSLEELPEKAKIGTTSPRRRASSSFYAPI